MGPVFKVQLTISSWNTQEGSRPPRSGKAAVKSIIALGIAEDVLVLRIPHELAAEFQIMVALGPGNIVTDLFVPRGISPGPRSGIVIDAISSANAHCRKPVKSVVIEQLGSAPSRGLLINADRGKSIQLPLRLKATSLSRVGLIGSVRCTTPPQEGFLKFVPIVGYVSLLQKT